MEKFFSILSKYYFNFKVLIMKNNAYQYQPAYPYLPKRSFTHVFIVWGSSSRKQILYGVGRATDSIMGVCQYPGRCYHSETCMAGVGNDVMYLSITPTGNVTLLTLYSNQRDIEKTSFIYTHVSLFAQ